MRLKVKEGRVLLKGATDTEIALAMADVMKRCYEHHSIVTTNMLEYPNEDEEDDGIDQEEAELVRTSAEMAFLQLLKGGPEVQERYYYKWFVFKQKDILEISHSSPIFERIYKGGAIKHFFPTNTRYFIDLANKMLAVEFSFKNKLMFWK